MLLAARPRGIGGTRGFEGKEAEQDAPATVRSGTLQPHCDGKHQLHAKPTSEAGSGEREEKSVRANDPEDRIR
jgi:hypothetical protein